MIKLNELFASKKQALILSILLLALTGVVDYVTDYELSLSVFYLIPIGLATWRTGAGWGMIFAIASGFVWFLNDYGLIERYYRNPLVPYWNALFITVFFIIISRLLTLIFDALKKERAASEMKSKLMHMVSHEFNNALTSLIGSSFLLRETDAAAGDPMRTKLYDTAEGTQRTLQMFVKNILNSARIEAGKLKIEPSTFAIRELITECLKNLETQITQKKITLENSLPLQPLPVKADRELILLVVSNLVGNAIKYTPAGGKIRLSIGHAGTAGKVAFSVENTGSGLNREELARVFDTFYRTETGKTSAEGFGLGLKISQEILLAHGSRLNVVSEQERSVEFSFSLDGAPSPRSLS